MKQQSPKLTRLNQQPTLAHSVLDILIRFYRWATHERAIVTYGRGDTDDEI
jgi:hypothetical protein